MENQYQRGGTVVAVLVLLVVLGAAGAWNYQRNMALEQTDEGPRPFKGYEDAGLEQLASAYQEEIDVLERKYQNSLRNRTGVSDDAALMDEHVKEFERVQKVGRKIREATVLVAEKEARLREISAERRFRDRMKGGYEMHLRRLVSI